ncbi:MAG TPA: SpoIID/LytB domain-containing protein [Myxococcales bacterium LLY-WYZ-16_1]|jgi:stage II sporulation protein D|nr:SpoIID/LytB domain-containing protein [Myxococcales bacterium LLY-WYZ-16_1]
MWGLALAGALGGTSPAAAEPEVRILLQEDRDAVRLEGEDLTLWLGPRPERVVPDRVHVRARGDGVVVRAGGRSLRGRRAVVAGDAPVSVAGGRYLGRVEVVPVDGRLIVVNRIRMETYLLGIVGSEMPPSWPAEALKAQAVAARTYGLQRRLRMRSRDRPYDLRDSVLSQVYRGAERIRPAVVRAVRATRGQVLAWRHEPAEALYHSTCGGRTRSAESAFGNRVAYLQPRPCRWCRQSTKYAWDFTLPAHEMQRLLETAGLARGKVRSVFRDRSAPRVRIRDDRGARGIDPNRFRAAVGYDRLFSSRFSARTRGGRVRVEGSGFGHGVGMCQWGARGMALEGKNYLQILAHYYDGAGIRRAY